MLEVTVLVEEAEEDEDFAVVVEVVIDALVVAEMLMEELDETPVAVVETLPLAEVPWKENSTL